jgi:hypothetical protein
MCLCSGGIKSRTIYHDGRDWIIEQRGEDYWSFPPDGSEWMQGLPPDLSFEDVIIIFDSAVSGRLATFERR